MHSLPGVIVGDCTETEPCRANANAPLDALSPPTYVIVHNVRAGAVWNILEPIHAAFAPLSLSEVGGSRRPHNVLHVYTRKIALKVGFGGHLLVRELGRRRILFSTSNTCGLLLVYPRRVCIVVLCMQQRHSTLR